MVFADILDTSLASRQQKDAEKAVPPSPSTENSSIEIVALPDTSIPSSTHAIQDGALTTASNSTKPEPIAIVSVACRLPGRCMNPQQLWEFLINGGIATSNSPPESRFNIKGHFDGSRKSHTMVSPGGMFIEDIDLQAFDAQFFNVNRGDTMAMEPQQRQLMEVVYECLENGGVSLESINGKNVGCFVATYAVDYGDLQARDPEDRVPDVQLGTGRCILSNRVSHFLNIKGPSMSIDTACSGGLISLDVACNYLQAGIMDGAIVAGANLNLDPEHTIGSGSLRGTISESARCHTFDAKADGYVKSEAINCVYIKRLKDAIRDGDPIRAVIRGTSSNSNGRTAGIASLSSEAQAAVTLAAYSKAGITDLSRTGFLECHGTGTPAGDPVETAGAGMVFSSSRAANDPLIIGSIKSNIGHSENAAGISALLKATMAVESGRIPGNPTFITPNPKIDFKKLHLRPSRTAINWPKSTNDYRRASVNSFGFGGTNGHVIIEATEHYLKDRNLQRLINHTSSYTDEDDDDLFSDSDDDDDDDDNYRVKDVSANDRRLQVLVFSANDADSLKAYLKKLRAHLLNPRVGIRLSDLAYTLSERRTKLFHRAFAVISGGTDGKVDEIPSDAVIFGKEAADAPRIGFVFTGQGAQWPQMGRDLLKAFPETAGSMIRRLDRALQDLSAETRPSWSLYDELTEPRTPEHMRVPEFSQPLITALQLALLEVLRLWGIISRAVVGHSSGEIAAACAAGLLTPEQAIKVAYLRGYAGRRPSSSEPLGMMAVGLRSDQLQPYLDALNTGKELPEVQIACYNSPSSTTLAGTLEGLHHLQANLKADGHFTRLLQVDLAYHSRYMEDISNTYERLLVENNCLADLHPASTTVKMFSTVTNDIFAPEADADAAYWKANMVRPVRFSSACQQLMKDQENGADFLIEVGPSNALAGPVVQNKEALTNNGDNITYTPAAQRGSETLQALYSVAGQLFLTGADISLARVNRGEGSFDSTHRPSTLVDLPNYAWNHATKYWHESEASKEWRFKKFMHHDILGSKLLGSSWNAPTWKKRLTLTDLPWIKDHHMGPDIVFPGSGYIAMAMEAAYQTTFSVANQEELRQLTTEPYHYQLRDIIFSRALVLDESADTSVMLHLTPTQGFKSNWYKYEVTSTVSGEVLTTTSHSSGFVRIHRGPLKSPLANPEELKLPLKYPAPAKLWYSAMADAGYGFGPCFQKQNEVEVTLGASKARSLLSLTPPSSKWKQSHYPLHPAALDGCFQTTSPALFNGDRSSVGALVIPAGVDNLFIAGYAPGQLPEIGLSISSAKYLDRGRLDDKVNWAASTAVYDPATGDAIFDMRGLRYSRLDAENRSLEPYPYTRLEWKPDLAFLSDQTKLRAALEAIKGKEQSSIHNFIDIAAHKRPDLAVLEVNLLERDATSLWLEKTAAKNSTRAACRAYHFISNSPDAVLEAENRYAGSHNAKFTFHNPANDNFDLGQTYQLAIVRVPPSVTANDMGVLARNILKLVDDDGHVLFIQGHSASTQVQGTTSRDPEQTVTASLSQAGFGKVHEIIQDEVNVAFAAYRDELPEKDKREALFELVQLPGTEATDTTAWLSQVWDARKTTAQAVARNSTVLIVDELHQPILEIVTEPQWDAIKELIRKECNMVWVTHGGQMNVTNPQASIAQGLFRSIRSEEPLLNIITLDVESNEELSREKTLTAIEHVLELAQNRPNKDGNDFQFVERGGILYIPRFLEDEGLHAAEVESQEPKHTVDIHASKSTIRLITGKRGDIDSLHWAEIPNSELRELEPGYIEIEIYAASLNFKDVVVAMGVIPENEHLLGIDGAGMVTRVGSGVTDRHVGQRVAVLERGTLANRVVVAREWTMAVPDSVSFEEAATMPLVFATSMHSLFKLANLQAGQKVLIHSAAGGLGIASIQLCHYMGCEVYATVGSDDKREFLRDSFGITDDRIFNSRNISFAQEIMTATNGYGVDVILNSLTGELLEESWRIIADGGTMVELGKQDILERRSLPMEPFGRNASFRGFDLSLKAFPKQTAGEHMDHLSELLAQGHVRSIHPMKVYSFEEIGDAFRYLGSGKHIGKLIISNGDKDKKAEVIVHPPKRRLATKLNPDHSYMIIGGLKGLCGSLVTWLAKNGAKHLAILSRSGSADEKSLGVIRDVEAQGCAVELLQGDVTNIEDVRRCLSSTAVPIGGIVQGAMVLRDRMFDSMTHKEYHEALACKVKGTWNLHTVSLELRLPLSFFTMLSSISGIVGNKGQANYAAGNTFQDALAVYRRDTLGLPGLSINLGIIEGIGYLAEHDDVHQKLTRNLETWAPLNEAKLRRIFDFSVYQQDGNVDLRPNPASATQMITGLAIPLPQDSDLLSDARFMGLNIPTGKDGDGGKTGDRDDRELQLLLLLLNTKGSDRSALSTAAVEVANGKFMKLLRLADPMEPSRPLSIYGLDSLVAVEFRNWARTTLNVELSTLDITNAQSLIALCDKIISKALTSLEG